jgi:hypothetical protein
MRGTSVADDVMRMSSRIIVTIAALVTAIVPLASDHVGPGRS